MYAHHQHANERGQSNNTAVHWDIEGWELEQEFLKQAEINKKERKKQWKIEWKYISHRVGQWSTVERVPTTMMIAVFQMSYGCQYPSEHDRDHLVYSTSRMVLVMMTEYNDDEVEERRITNP